MIPNKTWTSNDLKSMLGTKRCIMSRACQKDGFPNLMRLGIQHECNTQCNYSPLTYCR